MSFVQIARINPARVQFNDEEYWRITRAILALELHKAPTEIDSMSPEDVNDLLALLEINKAGS